MIILAGGTADARDLLNKLTLNGIRVLVCVATGYGASVIKGDDIEVLTGRLDRHGFEGLIKERGALAVVDASHPFAQELSDNLVQACKGTGIKYLRYKRPDLPVPGHPLVHMVPDYQAAAEKAADLGDAIFLTTGSKTAGIFLKVARQAGKRVFFRVLPDPEVIRGLIDMGVDRANIFAMQGPFGSDVNVALLKHCGASVLVTKESGSAGGFDEKISSALTLNIPVVVIERPRELTPGLTAEDILEQCLKIF